MNGNANIQTQKFKQLIKDDGPIHLVPVIIQEILQGIRSDEDFENILNLLDGFPVVTFDPIRLLLVQHGYTGI